MAKILTVSPHLDDAALSYGGRLAELVSAGHDVVVYTVFAGSPTPPYSAVAARFHEMWYIHVDPVQRRRDEDLDAMSLLGATPHHGGYLDSIYRKDQEGRWLLENSNPDGFQGDGEPDLVASIVSTIGDLIAEHRPEQVVTCAALGAHVDHQRARDAAATAAVRAGLPLTMWEDFPYIKWSDVVPALPHGLALSEPVAETVGPAAWETKNRAIECYKSQLGMLRYKGQDVFTILAEHAADRHARRGASAYSELVWRVSGNSIHPA